MTLAITPRRLALAAGLAVLAAVPAAAAPGHVVLVSQSSAGAQGTGSSGFAAVSPDGRYVAFSSLAGDLVAGDTNALGDVLLRDLSTGRTERVSVRSDGSQAGTVTGGFEASAVS